MINAYLLKNFDNSTLNYNLQKYPFHNLVKEVIKEKFLDVEELENIHSTIKPEKLIEVTSYVQNSFGSAEFSKLFDLFAEEYISPLIGTSPYLIKRFPTLNLVVPNQAKLGRLLNFHKGTFYSNGLGQGTIWMPLTRCYDSNSMYVVNHKESNIISDYYVNKKWSQAKFEQECLKNARPVTLKPGQAHLFHQEHLHGNINNTTGKSRLAIDWHVLLKGEEFHQRLPGGFFRLKGDWVQEKPKIENCVIYTSNNTKIDKHIPNYLQTSYIEKFCEQYDIKYSMRLVENEGATHLPMLEDIIKRKHNIILYSIHSLPEDEVRRNYLLDLCLTNNVKLYFMNEYILLSKDNLQKINKYLSWRTK